MGPQTRWSTIENEAYAIYWAFLRLDDLIGGVHFTILTDHATIEHVAGKSNIPVDVFSRLIVRPVPVRLHHVVILQCTLTQRTLIERFHTYLHAHWGVKKQ